MERNTRINAIAFSMNRAAQLDALLMSVELRASWISPVTVLFRFSTETFWQGYARLADLHDAIFTQQLPLRQILLRAIDPKAPLTMMLTDDDIFYRDLPVVESLPSGATYSPRLGKNCTYCYPLDKQQKEGELDFLYSLSIDGHIFRTEEILARIEAIDFDTPNQLEDRLSRGEPFRIFYEEHSCLVNVPHNRVAEYANRHEGGSPEELNCRFLAGERIDVDAMDFSRVVGAHQAIPYHWRKA